MKFYKNRIISGFLSVSLFALVLLNSIETAYATEIPLTDDFVNFMSSLTITNIMEGLREDIKKQYPTLNDTLLQSYVGDSVSIDIDAARQGIVKDWELYPQEMRENIYNAFRYAGETVSDFATVPLRFLYDGGTGYLDGLLGFDRLKESVTNNKGVSGGGGSSRGGGFGRGNLMDSDSDNDSLIEQLNGIGDSQTFGNWQPMPYSTFINSKVVENFTDNGFTPWKTGDFDSRGYMYVFIAKLADTEYIDRYGGTDQLTGLSFAAYSSKPISYDVKGLFPMVAPINYTYPFSIRFPNFTFSSVDSNNRRSNNLATSFRSYVVTADDKTYYHPAASFWNSFYLANGLAWNTYCERYATLYVYLDSMVPPTVTYNFDINTIIKNNSSNIYSNPLNIYQGDNYYDYTVNNVTNNNYIDINFPDGFFQPIPDTDPEPTPTPTPTVPPTIPPPKEKPSLPDAEGDGGLGIIDILSFLADFLSWMFGGISDLFGWLLSGIVDLITGAISGLLDKLKDLLIWLFVPSDDFWNGEYEKLKSTLEAKLPYEKYVSVIASLDSAVAASSRGSISGFDSNGSGFEDFTFTVMGATVVLPWSKYINDYLPALRSLIRGFFYLLLAYYNYRQIMFLIRGTTYSSIGNAKPDSKKGG